MRRCLPGHGNIRLCHLERLEKERKYSLKQKRIEAERDLAIAKQKEADLNTNRISKVGKRVDSLDKKVQENYMISAKILSELGPIRQQVVENTKSCYQLKDAVTALASMPPKIVVAPSENQPLPDPEPYRKKRRIGFQPGGSARKQQRPV